MVLFLVIPRETFPERYSVHLPVTQTDPFLVIHLDCCLVRPKEHRQVGRTDSLLVMTLVTILVIGLA